jgi:thiamine pyrophosphate-dependent acetolactate synthase large subunit-like protein
LELAELLTVPVAVTLAGKSCFPDDHPLCVGLGGWPRGLYATPHATRRTKDADVIVTIGCSFQLEASYETFPNDFKMIQIDVDATEMNKKRSADIPLLGDAKVILRQLVETLKAMLPKTRLAPKQDIIAAIAIEQKAWMDQSMPVLNSQDNPINPFRVTWEFSKLVDARRTIVTHDSGSSRGTLSQHYSAPTPRSFVAFGVQSGMGWTLGAAMGMKLAAPDKLVAAFIGDEAFGETGMELETAARNKLPVLWVLLNNRLPRDQLDLKKQPSYADRHALTGDYVAMAKALGCEASRVEDPAELSAALKRSIDAVNAGAPTLLEVKTRRVEAQLWGKIQR